MGPCNSLDVFQEKMNELVAGFEYVQGYIDNLLEITKGTYDKHLLHLDAVFHELEEAGLKISATKSCFAVHELEYLGYWISQDIIQPIAYNVNTIRNMAQSKNWKPYIVS